MKIVLFVKSILNSCLEIIQPYDQLVMLGKIEALGKLLMKFDKQAASDGKVWKYPSIKKNRLWIKFSIEKIVFIGKIVSIETNRLL